MLQQILIRYYLYCLRKARIRTTKYKKRLNAIYGTHYRGGWTYIDTDSINITRNLKNKIF